VQSLRANEQIDSGNVETYSVSRTPLGAEFGAPTILFSAAL